MLKELCQTSYQSSVEPATKLNWVKHNRSKHVYITQQMQKKTAMDKVKKKIKTDRNCTF